MEAESYVKLRNLTVEAREPIKHIVTRAANRLLGLGETGTIQFRLVPAAGEALPKTCFSIGISPAGVVVSEEIGPGRRGADPSVLTILATTDTFRRMADGSYSPVQAYLDGRLHLHGNVDLGKRATLHLAGSGSTVSVCPVRIDQTWQAAGALAVTAGHGFYGRQRQWLRQHVSVPVAGT